MNLDPIKELLSHILERLDSLDEKMEKAGAQDTSFGGDPTGPTRRYQNDSGDWVYDVTGCSAMKDRDTGESGFWVKTKSGKSIPVDVQGYPLWLTDRPLAQVSS
jgi:hypothetical protein